jgi:hypothetical protein
MYELRSKLVSLLAQASVFVQAQCVYPSQKTLAYNEICPFSVDYESVRFYNTGPRLMETKKWSNLHQHFGD